MNSNRNNKNGDRHLKTDKYLELDVHKDTIIVEIADGGRNGEVRAYGTIPNDLYGLERLIAKVGGEGVRLHLIEDATNPPKLFSRNRTGSG